MRSKLIPLALAVAALGACHQKTPQEKQADQIVDAADAKADSIEAAADNKASDLEAQAEQMKQQAGQAGTFEGRRMRLQAESLKEQAKVFRQEGKAKAKAVRDEGQAKASALLAQ
ncbi:hypothetical protein [Stakelama marina]|uniref:Lipoprotein n=1 Tax=Stakelama marina TaxID=2826939 RepID=A0A8T4IFJ2_9SPHN|nr:hypothetical protein [Stakelama marina]MBR0553221.1 hypothetical protein [Stakelama marina]